MKEFISNDNYPIGEIRLGGQAETENDDYEKFRDIVKDTYVKNGVDQELIEQFIKHNKQVEYFVVDYSKQEKFDAREREIAILAAIFHDIAKGGDFLGHGKNGGKIAEKILQENGVSFELAYSVRLAIERHMGGERSYPGRMAEKTYGEGFRFPIPRTRVEQIVYECDILTQLTPEGFEKILLLREKDRGNRKEDEEVAKEKEITREEAATLSALQSARESYELIYLVSIKIDATKLWEKIQEKYRDVLAK